MNLRDRAHLLTWLVAGLVGVASCGDGAPDIAHSSLTADEAASMRASCAFAAGALPSTSLAKDAPLETEIPIDHIIVLMMENRSFDHVLGDLRATQPDADAAGATGTNPDAKGNIVTAFHSTDYCFDDPDHGWDGTRTQYDEGKNDGFVIANQGSPNDAVGSRVMGYYTAADLPYLYWMANEFAVGDRYFSALLGPTFPNRLFLYAATSFGYIDNTLITANYNDIMETLEAGKVDWHVYSEAIPGMGVLLASTSKYLNKKFDKLPAFYTNASAGTLPQVTFLDPDLSETQGGNQDDFHPPGDVQVGDQFLANVVKAVMASPEWPRTALFITFDEHGGIYDHVPPPQACTPDGTPPKLATDMGADAQPGFDRLGFRVPLIVVSPYAKRHYVSHGVYDHTSILRFIEARFGLPAMTMRDANADPLFDLFDFGNAVTTTSTPPTVIVDQAKLGACQAKYPMTSN